MITGPDIRQIGQDSPRRLDFHGAQLAPRLPFRSGGNAPRRKINPSGMLTVRIGCNDHLLGSVVKPVLVIHDVLELGAVNEAFKPDQIIVLDNGEIADMGNHEELLERNPIYSEIYHSQLVEDSEMDDELEAVLSMEHRR